MQCDAAKVWEEEECYLADILRCASIYCGHVYIPLSYVISIINISSLVPTWRQTDKTTQQR